MNRREEIAFNTIKESLKNCRNSWVRVDDAGDQTVFLNQKIKATIKLAMPFVLVNQNGMYYCFGGKNAEAIVGMVGLEALVQCAMVMQGAERENFYATQAAC
jgi:hypothetical protein